MQKQWHTNSLWVYGANIEFTDKADHFGGMDSSSLSIY